MDYKTTNLKKTKIFLRCDYLDDDSLRLKECRTLEV